MKLNISEVSVMFTWLQSRIDEMGGVENLALVEKEMITKIIMSNDEVLQVFKEIERNETMRELFSWVDGLPDKIKENILNS